MTTSQQTQAFFIIAIALYLAISFALYPIYSPDFFSIWQFDDHYGVIINADLASGRFFSAAGIYVASLFRIDPLTSYPLYLAASAVTAAFFIRRLYLKYYRFPPSWLLYGFLCFSFFISGPMIDFLLFREVPHHPMMMFGLAYLYLLTEDIESGLFRNTLKIVLVVAIFATYQAAVVMLIVLSILRGMFDLTDGQPVLATKERLFIEVIVIVVGFIVYLALKGMVDMHFATRIDRPFLDLHDPAGIMRRVWEHVSSLWQFFQTPGTLYKWSHVGLGLSVSCIGFVLYLLATRGLNTAPALFLTLAMIGLLQNPMNVLMSFYWPTLRASFYVALIPGIIMAYLYSRIGASIVQRTAVYILGGLVGVYATAALMLVTDGYEMRNRDYMLAHDIAAQIRTSPDLLATKKIRISEDWGRMMGAYYVGVRELGFDFGAPLMSVKWSVGPYIRYATGVDYEYSGPAICPHANNPPTLRVSLYDGAVNVCF